VALAVLLRNYLSRLLLLPVGEIPMTGRTILRLLAAGAVLLPALARAQSGTVPAENRLAGDGYRLTIAATTTTSGMFSGFAPSQEQTYTQRILDGMLRTDLSAGMNAMLRKGMYSLYDSRSGKLTVVDTAARSMTVMNPLESMSVMPGNGEVTIADTASQLEDLGPGETVLGFATRKYRFTVRYEMRMGMMGTSMSVRMTSIATMHMNQELAANDPALGAFQGGVMQNSVVNAGGAAMSQLAALMQSAPKGFAMISDEETRMDMSGNENITRHTMRVTEFSRGGVQPADMQVPTGYKTVDLNAVMRQAMEAVKSDPPESRR